jgi:hypothetical protein
VICCDPALDVRVLQKFARGSALAAATMDFIEVRGAGLVEDR